MNRVSSYTGTTTATGGEGKYPLSTEALDFIQEQILLLQTLAGIGGSNYILRQPSGNLPGVAVIMRAEDPKHPNDKTAEVVEIATTPQFSAAVKYLTITTTTEDITADAEKYLGARTRRLAQFTTSKGAESYDINTFANVANKALGAFPTNAQLAAQVQNMPVTVLNSLRDVLAEKLTAKPLVGLTKQLLDGLKTPCVLSCSQSVALFGMTDYTVIVTQQGSTMVRQELIQGQNQRYVRTYGAGGWSTWAQQVETAMHIDVKIVGTTVWLRHGALGADCDIVLLRKKRRSAWRSTGGANAYTKNRGKRKRRQPKRQYVHYKGIKLSKGEPGKWYVPKCVAVADPKTDGNLIGKEMPTLCATLFYQGANGFCRIQGSRKKMVLKNQNNKKGTQHRGYASIGVQIARLKPTGGKDSGGEIARMKYRISQTRSKNDAGTVFYSWKRSFSVE